MSWILEIALAPGAQVPATDRMAAPLHTLPGLATLDAYSPAAQGDGDPLNPAETPPPLMLVAGFASEAALRTALQAPALQAALDAAPDAAALTLTPMRAHFYPVPDGPGEPLAAPVSYVVRYMLPAEDADAFRAHYMADHPPTQARLPGIRSILCYTPLAQLRAPGAPPAPYLIGNEVAFDSAEAFAAAMRAPARAELRAHMAGFPPYSGVNTHHLMMRTRLRSAAT